MPKNMSNIRLIKAYFAVRDLKPFTGSPYLWELMQCLKALCGNATISHKLITSLILCNGYYYGFLLRTAFSRNSEVIIAHR